MGELFYTSVQLRGLMTSLESECARFFDGDYQFLPQHLKGGVRWKVDSVEASVGPAKYISVLTLEIFFNNYPETVSLVAT